MKTNNVSACCEYRLFTEDAKRVNLKLVYVILGGVNGTFMAKQHLKNMDLCVQRFPVEFKLKRSKLN